MDFRNLNISVTSNIGGRHEIHLSADELNYLPHVLARIVPLLHTVGFEQTIMTVKADETIVFSARKPEPFVIFEPKEDPVNSIYEDEDQLVEAEKALYEPEDNGLLKVGDRVQVIEPGHPFGLRGVIDSFSGCHDVVLDNWRDGHGWRCL